MSSPRRDRRTDDRDIWRRFRYHSRTFSLAAHFFPKRIRMPVATLYLFCRTVDEIADRVVLETGSAGALVRLKKLEASLDQTLHGDPPDQMLWTRLAEVHSEFRLNRKPMDELIAGARWDLEGRRVQDVADLVDYSNLVGGSIGAMMLPVLGLHADRAVEARARDLGIGMQITNIIRDVGEDRRTLHRSYIPVSLADEYNVDLDSLNAEDHRYHGLMEQMMHLAEKHYESGLEGVQALPRSVRPAIRAATRFYREILNEVRASRYDNLSRRAYVSCADKAAALFPGRYEKRKSRILGMDGQC